HLAAAGAVEIDRAILGRRRTPLFCQLAVRVETDMHRLRRLGKLRRTTADEPLAVEERATKPPDKQRGGERVLLAPLPYRARRAGGRRANGPRTWRRKFDLGANVFLRPPLICSCSW